MQKIENFISETIANHVFDISHQAYSELQTILDSETIKELTLYLRRDEDKKFKNSVAKIVEDFHTKENLLLLIESLRAKQKPPKGIIKSKGSDKKSKICTLFYATNRKPKKKGYGDKRSREISLGTCDVYIPESHKRGEISSSLLKKIIKFDMSHGELKVKSINPKDSFDFWSDLNELLAPLEEEEKQALIFLHGYNTSFKDAAIRTAQIAVDIEYPGVTAFFSWPSKGSLWGYLSDEASIQYSERYITKFLVDFCNNSGANRIHIIAHSMGNRGLVEAIDTIKKEHSHIKFGQIILAAPDVDADVFNQKAFAYTEVSDLTTLYVSSKDKAVGASEWIHAYDRIGFTPPVKVIEDIDTIEVDEEVNLLDLGHGYFAQHKAILEDIEELLNLNLHAQDRPKLTRKRDKESKRYWKLKV